MVQGLFLITFGLVIVCECNAGRAEGPGGNCSGLPAWGRIEGQVSGQADESSFYI